MAPTYLRMTYLSETFSACGSSSRLAQICSSSTQSGSRVRLLTLCVLFSSSLHFVLCSAKLRVCSSCSFTNARSSQSSKSFQPLKDRDPLLYVRNVNKTMVAQSGIISIRDEDDRPSNKPSISASVIPPPLHRALNSTVSANSKDQKSDLWSCDSLHTIISPTGRDSSSGHGRVIFQYSGTFTSEATVEYNLAAAQRRISHFSGGDKCLFPTGNAPEHRGPRTAYTSRTYASGAPRTSTEEIPPDSNTWSKQRYLQHNAATSSSSAPVSAAHPGVSVLGRVGQNAEINGEYVVLETDSGKDFLFKKLLRTYSEATPLYLFSSRRAPSQHSEHDRQQRSSPVYWAIGEIPYVNEKIRAFVVSDATYPDLISGIWSVFEQQNNETVLVPDKFVIVVRVGCNNGATDGNESGMDCGGSCETLCDNMRDCRLPRTLPVGYALGSCPLDGMLQHGEGCTYKCPLGWKENGALGRVCYDGTLLEIRRGPGCEEAFSSIMSHPQQCQFLLLEGAPPKKARREAEAARALAEQAEGRDAVAREEDAGGGRISLLSTAALKRRRRAATEQAGKQKVTLLRRTGRGTQPEREAGRDGDGGEIVPSEIAAEGRGASPKPAEREGGELLTEEETAREGRLDSVKEARDVDRLKGGGRRRKGGTEGEAKEVVLPASAGTSETAGILVGRVAPRQGRTDETIMAAGGSNAEQARGTARPVRGDAVPRGAATARIKAKQRGADATSGDTLRGGGGKSGGDFTEREEELQPHVCNGLFIMHAVRGGSGQRAVFWQRDADGLLIQLYWEDGYWVCASFDKDVEYGYIWDPFPSRLVQAPSTPLLGSRGVWAVEETKATTESTTSLHCVDPLRSVPKQACVAVYFSRWKNPRLQGYFYSVLPPSADGRPRYINENQLLLHWTPLGYWVAGDVEDQTAALALTFSPSTIPPLTGWRSWNAEARHWEKEEEAQVQCVEADDRVLPPHATAAGTVAGAAGAAAGGGASQALPPRTGYSDVLESLKTRNSHYGYPAQILDVTRTVIRSAGAGGPLLEALLNFDAGVADIASDVEDVSLHRLPPVSAATLPGTAAPSSATGISVAEIGSDSCAHVLLDGGRGFGESCNGIWSKQKQQQQQSSLTYMYKLSVDSRVLYLYHAGGQWRCTADGVTLLGYSDAVETSYSRSENGGNAVVGPQARGNWLDGRRYVRGNWTLTCISKPAPPPQCDELSVSDFVEAAEVFNGKWTRSDAGGQQRYTKMLTGPSTPPPLFLLHQQQDKKLLHLFYHPLSLWVIGSSLPSSSNASPKFFAYAMKSNSSAPPSGLWTVFDGNLNRAVLHLVDIKCISRLATKVV